MAEEKKLPLPEKELPPPHDMQLPASSTASNTPNTPKDTSAMSNFWRKYGSKKWLLPLIILLVVLVVIVGAAAFMGASNEPMTRKEKRMERQEKRQQRQERKQQKNKNNKKQNNKNNKNNKKSANATANTAVFTYGNGVNQITLQYDAAMKTNISEGTSILGGSSVPLITFTGDGAVTRLTIEPNPNNQTAAVWQANLGKNNDTYNTPTESLTVSGKPAVMQHTLSQTANWIAYVPMSGKMLVINMNYAGGKNKAKDVFVDMVKTITIGPTTTAIPTLPTTPTTPAQ